MDLFGKTIVELRELLKKGELSPQELKEYFNDRIKKYDKKLNSFVTLGDSTMEAGKGELTGIPMAVKDNFCTTGLRTTASAKVLDQFIPQYESTVTRKLKEEGATFLGKANMDAWAHGSSTETSDYGPSLNPWDTSRIPGGSSGGSAVAVGAYLAPVAIGSETGGSTRLPAAWTGTIGVKPTYGRVSRYGVVAMGSSLDSPGPIGISVEDTALILEKIAGHDPYDATSIDAPVDQYSKEMKKKRTFTIGISDQYFEDIHPEILEAMNRTIEVLKKMGHKFKKIELIEPKYSISVYTIIQRAEVSSNLSRYHGIRYSNPRGMFGKEAKKRVMLGGYTLSVGYYDAFYKKAQKVRTLIIEDFKKAYSDVDLIIAPTTPITALKRGDSEKYPFFGEVMDVLLEPSSIAGLPALSVPVGLDNIGLPIGMQIIGNSLREVDTFALAYQLEQETDFYGVIKEGLAKWK
ncbi:Asp-tRNA(Asn)/Glu-tRNA(Gln) amidotransferase subunit GatA [Candidatus Nomurabacteria bacterium]|nr:Asp-tRNA(Asn)/Glu-tRNA(Gln) amidotransferase subunit GatA [Candidatus Nomurabacteria bacterium]MCB9803969.1 Asp-tRNA(Asn)/Glu-tRNA(Gln) amidotransferase subunit GatA [Candidatus Nomurabacteria bacterium]